MSFSGIFAIVVKMAAPFIFFLAVLGFSGIVAQTVLIRESLIIYGGNELSLGMIIGSWVIWEALGAYAGGRLPRRELGVSRGLITANLLFALFFPATIIAVRTLKITMGVPPEMSLGLTAVFASSLVLFMPCSLLHGLSFTLSCRFSERAGTGSGASAARTYFFEMGGTIIGGAAVSYFLITRLHSLRIACLLLGIMAAACFVLSLYRQAERNPKNAAAAASVLLGIASVTGMTFGYDDFIETRSIHAQWHGRNVISYENSHYQNIVVTKDQEQYTFFTNGIPAQTLPTPDIVRVEEIVHLPGLAHGSPRDVLIIHGGTGGIISEMLKYAEVQRIDYVEIDPAYLKIMANAASGMVRSELGSDRVRVHYTDGRRFVKEARGRYDMVLSGIAAPRTLEANRYFTAEFFGEIRDILKPEGIFVFTLPGSLAYYDRELTDMNASILLTAAGIFRDVAVIPGEENIFLASPKLPVTLSPADLDKRRTDHALKTRLISLPHLTYRLDPERQEWFNSAVKNARPKTNHDLAPMGLYYALAYDNALHGPSLKGIFTGLEKYGQVLLFLLSAGLAALGFMLRRRYAAIPVLFVTLTTGFSVMVLELLLIFVYQAYSGYVFHEIGMLMTMLMAGMAAGALAAGPFSKRFGVPVRSLIRAEIALAATCITVPALFLIPGIFHGPQQALLRFLLFTLLFIAGFFTGIEFPLATEIYGRVHTERTAAGPVYGIDLAGGFMGGIAGGFFLFPLMGLTKTCLFLFALKVCGIVMLFCGRRK